MDKLEIIKLVLLIILPLLVIVGVFFLGKYYGRIKLKVEEIYYRIAWKYHLWKSTKYIRSKADIFQKLAEIKKINYKSVEEEEFDYGVTKTIRDFIDNTDMFIISKDSNTLEYDKNRVSARFDKTKLKLKNNVKEIILNSFNYEKHKFRVRLTFYLNALDNDLIKNFYIFQNNQLNKINETINKEYGKIFVATTQNVGSEENSKYNVVTYSFIYSFEIDEKNRKILYDDFKEYFNRIIIGFIIENLQKIN